MNTVVVRQYVETKQSPNSRAMANYVLQRESSAMSAAFLRAHRSTTMDQTDRFITTLYARVMRGSVRVFDHLLMFARNWFSRGASQEAVEGIGHAYLAIVRSWYGSKPSPGLTQLVINEANAQGPADVRTFDLIANPSALNIADAHDRLSEHLTHLTALVEELGQRRYAGQAAQ